MKDVLESIWFEKYRSPSVAKMILPPSYAEYFGKIVRGEHQLPNLFLYSSKPGTGKTTIAKALCADIDAELLYINVSQDSGKDTLTEIIDGFAITRSIGGRIKVVLMDEVDGASPQLQKALRAAIEGYAGNCRFILTANYENKVIEPLRDRCERMDFNFQTSVERDDMIPRLIKRFHKVLEHEGVEYDPSVVAELVETMFPDVRKIYQLLQKYNKMYGGIDSTVLSYERDFAPLWEAILAGDYKKFRSLMSDKSVDPSSIYRPMFDELVPRMPENARAQAILTIDDYMTRAVTTMDQEITASACAISLIGLARDN